ncbi:MAG TPA: glycoside hydrolase family 43 protein [Ferruginibacter sp.]|nr:glycoside hydrolase family 43 protein [Ferruginibacter sp.]
MQKILLLLAAFFISVISVAQLTYTNPVLAGFYPDPSICRAGDDYYLVNSSFAYFPGLPIFHSKDLVNWKQVGHAMNRPEQLPLQGAGVSRGLFAPAISYHNGIFYIVCTLIDKLGNFVITAKDPKGPWSNPVALPQVNGIDPSLFFDDNGKSYIVFNSIPPNNISLHDGHRTIRMFEFDAANLRVAGEEKLLVNGGTDMAKKPVWIEGPHIFKKDGWYYLICAEGGTGYNHSEVVFRSKSLDEPFVSYERNPILTQRHLDAARKYPVTTTGHADFVKTKEGNWYAVFLGCRPYEGEHYNIGRETFMLPVHWENGWPHILEENEEVKYAYPVPMPAITKKLNNPFGGNAFFSDEFNESTLNDRFVFLRTPVEPWYSLTEKIGWLSLKLRKETCGEKVNPSFIAFRQQNHRCTASTSVQFDAKAENEKAGMVIFQNETHYYYLCKSISRDKPVVQLYQSSKDSSMTLLASRNVEGNTKELGLRIEARNSEYHFYFSPDGKNWTSLIKEGVDAKFLSTKTAGGFVGSVFALYASCLGKGSDNKVYFNYFHYRGDDDVLK